MASIRLVDLSETGAVQDAALVEWEQDEKKPHTRQVHDLAGPDALSAALWEMLFGLIFLVPLLTDVAGAAHGDSRGSLAAVGMDDRFLSDARTQVVPRRSALFVLGTDDVVGTLRRLWRQTSARDPLVVQLDDDSRQALRQVFPSEDRLSEPLVTRIG
jgi:uncharacterized membrane protein